MHNPQVDVFKGISISLIVFAHNPYFLGPSGLDIQELVYGFHITNFFLLSCVMNNHVPSQVILITRFKALFKPFVFFAILSAVLFSLLFKSDADKITLWNLMSFHAGEINIILGFKALWFPVAFATFYILCLLCNSKNKLIVVMIVTLGLIVNFNYNFLREHHVLMPFGLLIALYLLPISIGFKKTQHLILRHPPYAGAVISGLLMLLTLYIGLDDFINPGSFKFFDPISQPRLYLLSICYAILGYAFVWYISAIFKNNELLAGLGKYSYQVYFIHLYINFVLTHGTRHFITEGITSIVAQFFASLMALIITFSIASRYKKIPVLKSVF